MFRAPKPAVYVLHVAHCPYNANRRQIRIRRIDRLGDKIGDSCCGKFPCTVDAVLERIHLIRGLFDRRVMIDYVEFVPYFLLEKLYLAGPHVHEDYGSL